MYSKGYTGGQKTAGGGQSEKAKVSKAQGQK